MQYRDVVAKIESIKRFGNVSGREVTEHLLPELGNPDRGMKIIHVAGTNGKGSVAMYTAAALEANGYRTGLFTSPHLLTIRERIQVNRRLISEEDFTSLAQQVLAVTMPDEYAPTFFDICLAVALLYFRQCHCDYVVLETGLGGRLDSTRGIHETPVAGVITAIGLDHTAILGNTVEEIASEKAGIIRKGMPVAVAHNPECVRKVIEERADIYLDVDEYHGGHKSLIEEAKRRKLAPPLAGDFQYDNEASALAVLVLSGAVLDRRKVIAGIRSVKWPARIQKLCERPVFIVDGSHNPQGVEALADTLRRAYPKKKFVFIMAAMADKDAGHMIEYTKNLAYSYICVRADTTRSLDAADLAGMVRQQGIKASEAASVSEALYLAEESSKPVVAFGSLYLAGEILREFRKRQNAAPRV